MIKPSVSIVIPTFNRPQALKACLAALKAQDYRGSWEVIVVDDGSYTDTGAIIAAFSGRVNLHLLRQDNRGPAAARNAGVQQAKYDYLAFLDDDCEPDPNWLESMATHLISGLLVGGRTENKLSSNLYSETSQLLVAYLYEYFKNTPWYFFTSNNFAMDKISFLQVGGFDQSFLTSAGEDRAFCVKWGHQGKRLEYVSDALVWHSHKLTFQTFCQLHMKYGRASRQFRTKLSEWGVEPVRTKMSFYTGLLAFARRSDQHSARHTAVVMALFALSQLCVLWGVINHRPRSNTVDS